MTDAPPSRKERGGFFSGTKMLLLTLSLVIIVPVVTYVAFELASRDVREAKPSLDWTQRQSWSGVETTTVTFRRGMNSSARTGKTFDSFGFSLEAETVAALQACAKLARQPREPFAQTDVRDELEAIIARHPGQFYPQYLLGTWHRLNNNALEAKRHFTLAFERAGAVLVQPYKTSDGDPASGRTVPTLAIAIDRIVADRLIQNVQLVYPHLRTDDTGRVYLPLFADTPYRFVDLAAPTATGKSPAKGWFTFPGRIGRAEPRTISGSGDDSANNDSGNGGDDTEE